MSYAIHSKPESQLPLILAVVVVVAVLIYVARQGNLFAENFATSCTCTDTITGVSTTTVQNNGPNVVANGYTGVMYAGDVIKIGNTVTSPNGNYTLTLTTTSLELTNKDGKVTWFAGRGANGINNFVMQSDGNAVIYDSLGHAVWATGTNHNTANVFKGFTWDEQKYLAVQDDGNVVVYGLKTGKVWWAIW